MDNKQHKEFTNLFAQYNRRLGRLYSDFVKKLLALGYSEDNLLDNPLFNFDNFPELRARLNDIFADYVQNSMLCYKSAVVDGFALAMRHAGEVLTVYSILSEKAVETVRNTAADVFFRSRFLAKSGLNLATKVWNYCSQGKSEIETALSNVIADGLKKGTSAEELGRLVRQYLNNPDMMYRRYHRTVVDNAGNKKDIVRWRCKVVGKDGKVHFIEQPLEQVGMGTYRSSRMNALRMMRTEINAAYHIANNERWAKEPFVIGQRIELSPEHPKYDICDELVGNYPKDFVFTGFHPQCLCASVAITLQGKEKEEFYKRMMNGEDMTNYVSPNRVKDVPNAFKRYVSDNHDKIIEAQKGGKLAWHLRDNTKYWIGQFSAAERKEMGLLPISTKDRIKQIANARHAARTEEEKKRLADWWHEHKAHDALNRKAAMTAVKKEPSLITRIDAELDKVVAGVKKVSDDKVYYTNICDALEKYITPQSLPISAIRAKSTLFDAIDFGVSQKMLDNYFKKYKHKLSILEVLDREVGLEHRTRMLKKIQDAKKTGIEYREVAIMKPKSHDEIVERLAGGDKTKGSCSSLAFAYAGNRANLDVIDFRNGASRDFFAKNGHINDIITNAGGTIIKGFDDFKSAKKLLFKVEEGKEYYMAVGKHAAIVKKEKGIAYYLELQSGIRNGYKPLNNHTLKDRFSCKHSHSEFGRKYEVSSQIVEISRLTRDKGFKELLGYINTDPAKQVKGVGGGMK